MSHEYDGSSHRPREGADRYMVERRVTPPAAARGASAQVGPAAALAPVIAACSSARRRARPRPHRRPRRRRRRPPRPPRPRARRPRAAPTPVPRPRSELFVYNWTEYIGEDTIPSFEEKYGVKVTYDFFSNTDEAYAKLGNDGGGYDVSFPISVDIPDVHRQGRPAGARQVAASRTSVNLGAEWANPGYDPGNEHSMPYMWWTTGVAYDTSKITDTLTSSKALWDPRFDKHIAMLDDWQEVFGAGADPARLRRQHDRPRPARRGPGPARAAEAAGPRVLAPTPARRCAAGDIWIGQVWGADIYQIQEERERWSTTSPRRAASAGRTRWRSSRGASTRSPRTCSSTTCSTRRSAPRTRTTSTTWARTPPPRSSSTRPSWPTRP